MADQLSLRGGTTSEHATFTGANKEVTVDTTKKTLVVNDGATVGGHPLMRENASNSALALGSAGTPSLKFTGDTNTGIYSPGADQLAISTNGTQRLTIDASGNVISAGNLYANGTNGLVLFNADPTNYNVSRSGGDLTFKGGATVNVSAGGGTSTLVLSNSPYAAFNVGGSERARIDSSGRLLVGTSTSQSIPFPNGNSTPRVLQVDSFDYVGIGIVSNAFTGNPTRPATLTLSRTGSNSDRTTAVLSSNELGAIQFTGYSGGHLQAASILGVADTGTISGTSMPGRLVFSTTADGAASPTERMRITNAGHVLVGTATVNTSGAKLQTSNGLTFPATAVASADPNTLDDYEEGTWTPQAVSTGTGATATATIAFGSYVKIGKAVHFTLRFEGTSAAAGSFVYQNFPFTSANVTNQSYVFAVTVEGSSATTPTSGLYAKMIPNTSYVFVYNEAAPGTVIAQSTSPKILVTGTYYTA